jgi:ABC-type oligopeptide transport system substrate-binding subunit
MRKTLLLSLILLISAAWVVAQSTSSPSSQSSPSGEQSSPSGEQSSPSDQMGSQSSQASSQTSSGMNKNENQIEGCLSGSAGNFTLTDKSGITYQLQGDTSQLNKHVGQEVRINGSNSAASSAAAPSSGSASSSSAGASSAGAGAAAQTFNVTKVKKIASTCSSAGSSNPSK